MRDLFLKDWAWKLFSLVLAAAIWLTVNHILNEPNAPAPSASGSLTVNHILNEPNVPAPSASGSQVIYKSLSVAIVSARSDVHLYRINPGAVSVTVSGPRKIIGKLQANQIRPMVDLTGFDPVTDSEQHVDVSVPDGITLVRVDPAKVNVIVPPKTEPQPKP